MASGISFSGLSSGLDTDSIITALTQAETTQKTTIQNNQAALKSRQAAYATVRASLNTLTRAAGNLTTATNFSAVKATVSDDDIASITTTIGATASTYDLNVTSLAKANKIASAGQTDSTTALGLSGTSVVNGKAFKVESTDSLKNIAQKINGLGAGVTASIVEGGPGKTYLTLTSAKTGTDGAVSVADGDGSLFATLGVAGSGSTVRAVSGNTATSFDFSSKTTSLSSMLGASSFASGTINIGGTDIAVDPSTDTLETLAAKINAAGISGVTASIDAVKDDSGSTDYHLSITGSNGAPAMTDTSGTLRSLGVLKAAPGNELVAAKNAAYTLDGVSLTSQTNTISNVIGGATVTFKKEGSVNLALTNDTSALTDKINTFVTAVNSVVSSVDQQSTLDTTTYNTGVLFGDSVARQVKDGVRNLVFSDSPGITGSVKNLASVGFGLDSNGAVTFDSDAFTKALAKDPDGVSALFRSMGTGSNGNIKYVSSTSDAVASGTGGYAVNITQAATKGSFVAGTAMTSARTSAESLTFTGPMFGASGMTIDFEVGTDLAATVAKINGDSRLKDLVTASVQNGALRIDSKKFGTPGNFTVTSNDQASGNNSGIGPAGTGTKVAGLDVAGTINGETAIGSGDFLTGAKGTPNVDGLQIEVLGTATGNVGTINYSKGVASRMQDLITGFTKDTTGLLSAADASLQKRVDDMDDEISTIDTRLASKKDELTQRFAAMETALQQMQTQMSTLTQMLNSGS